MPTTTAPARPARAGRTATLLSTASDEAATSLLPALLSGTLAASPVALGIIEGLASATDGAARLGGGALSEDPRRRGWISTGSFAVMAALTGLIAVAASATQVGVLRAGASTARGLRSPQRYASVPERVGSAEYGRAFGFERAVHHLAAVGGPLLAFLALALLDVRAAFLVVVVPGLVATAIGVRLLRARRAAGGEPARRRAAPAAKLRVRAVYQGRLGRLMAGITVFELVNFASVLLVLRATKLLEQQDVLFGAAAMAVLLYLLWRLAAAPAAWGCGRLVDRFGPVPVMAGGVAALLGAYAGFAFAEGTVAQLALCFAVAGAAGGAIEAAEHVGVAQVAPEELRWSAFGSLSAVRSFGRVTATIGATVVWTALGAEWGLVVASPVMVVAVAVMARGFTRGPAAGPPSERARRARAVLLAATAVVLPLVGLLLLAAAGALRSYP
jgi:MFS family permease